MATLLLYLIEIDLNIPHAHNPGTAIKRMHIKLEIGSFAPLIVCMRINLENSLFAHAYLPKFKLFFVSNCWFVIYLI